MPAVAVREAPETIDERTVAAIWERQAFDPTALLALGIEAIFRGLPSDAGGPDYQDAVLSLGSRRIISGDVEFHVDGDDWYRHQHHLNPRYNNVILHVVWQNGREPARTEDGREVFTLALADAVGHVPSPSAPPLLTHPCVNTFARLNGGQLEERIGAAGLLRLEERAEYFAAEVATLGPDQAIYAALLEACGYASNREAFRTVADAAPFHWLMSIPPDIRATALLEVSGLAPASGVNVPVHLPSDTWRLQRLRPQNHPERRLRGIARLLDRLGSHPADALVNVVVDAQRPSDLRRALVVEDTAGALIGAGRADEIAVSVVLPFVMGMEGEAARALYLRYPSPPHNRWTRLMVDLLAQAGHSFRVRRAPEHQGLHWLYHGNCRKEGRHGCLICASS